MNSKKQKQKQNQIKKKEKEKLLEKILSFQKTEEIISNEMEGG